MEYNQPNLLLLQLHMDFKSEGMSLFQKRINGFLKAVLCFAFMSFVIVAKAQVTSQVASPNVAPPNGNPPTTPNIIGSASISPGTASSVYTTTAGTSGVSFAWSTSNNSAGSYSVSTSGTTSTLTINWISSYSGTVYIYCTASNTYGASPQGSKAVVVTGASSFAPGTTSPATQSINYNTSPAAITSTTTGGSGAITYQWQSSLSQTGGWSNVTNGTGATTNNYTPPALSTTTYFHELATNNGTTVTNPTATVTVYPQVVISGPSPASQTIQSGATAANITSSSVTGGTGNSYTYQWQSSPDGLSTDFVNINATNNPYAWATTIGSATTATLSPGNVYSTTYYRLQVTNNGGVTYSNSSVVTVLDCYPLNTAPAKNTSYIITSTIKQAGVTSAVTDAQLAVRGVCDVNQTIQYMDGLGRPVQTVAVKGSPGGNDIVQPIVYDQYGRETTKYLPYVTPGTNDGAYRSAAVTEQATYYNPTNSTTLTQQGNGIVNTSYPYAVTNFESSPLNRVTEQGATGSAWQPVAGSTMGHTNKIIYTTNNGTSFAADSVNGKQVTLYEVTINPDNSRTLTKNGFYNAGTLYLTITQDENWHTGRAGTIEEYKDLEGHVVLKRVYNSTGSPVSVQMLSTYYVYDDLGNLCYVLPPVANPDNINMAQATYDNLCYQYWYDARNRLFRKKLPGKGWEFIVYNTLDQVVNTQDANQRNKTPQQWTIIDYDAQGRQILTALYNYTGSTADPNISSPNTSYLNTIQASYNTSTLPKWENRSNSTSTGYDQLDYYPGETFIYLTMNYYDDYTITGSTPAGVSSMTRGLPTVTKTAVLNTLTNATPTMLTASTYYDDLGRVIQVNKQHYFNGVANVYNYDQITNTYDFANELTGSTRQHYVTNSGNTAATLSASIVNTYVYDHEGRKLQTWEQINGGTNILLSNNVYNEIGQLWNKQLHSTNSGSSYLQTIAYTYNERGWLLSDTAPLFEESLQYNTGTSKQYNGNIAYANWGTASAPDSKSYAYSYDKLNRLLGSASTTTTNNESGITYDAAGNITALTRTGYKTDNLVYTYTDAGSNYTNQLQSVTDGTGSTGLVSGKTTYLYDLNGNVASQTNAVNTQNKSYVYNILNLPQVITLPTGTITYTYDANGDKLRKVSVISGTTTTEDYISGIQHNTAGAIDFILTEEGRALNSAGNYHYEYSLTDHLGNERLTFDTYNGTANSVQSDDYYPFGLEISTSTVTSPKNEYLYNKKELQEELTQYDYGARFYDPVVARWTVIDPHAENYQNWNPYNYVANCPILLTDPDGMDWFYQSKDGKSKPIWVWHDGHTYDSGLKNNGKEIILTGVQAVIVFEDKSTEKLGTKNVNGKEKGGYIDGKGAVTATVTVYGPNGPDDIQHYKGYTSTSDPSRFAMIADGIYDGNYDPAGKSGKLQSHWVLNARGEIPDVGKNIAHPEQYDEDKNYYYSKGIFIHRPNLSGYAGGNVSEGCLLITPGDWKNFNNQLEGVKNFAVQIIRDQPVKK